LHFNGLCFFGKVFVFQVCAGRLNQIMCPNMNVCNHPRRRKRAPHCKSMRNVTRKATKKNLQRTFANVFSCVSTFDRLRLDKGYFSKVLYGLQSVHEAVASCVEFATSVAKCVIFFILFYVCLFRFCFTVIMQSFGVNGVMQTIAHFLQLVGTSPHLGKIRCNNKKIYGTTYYSSSFAQNGCYCGTSSRE